MTKERRTVSLPPEIDAYLSREGVNASELVAKLVRQHMNGGAGQDQILEFRIEQVKSELDEVEGKVERKRSELQELQERKQRHQKQQQRQLQSKLSDAREALAEVPKAPENPAIQNWADNLEMTPEELIDKLTEEDD